MIAEEEPCLLRIETLLTMSIYCPVCHTSGPEDSPSFPSREALHTHLETVHRYLR